MRECVLERVFVCMRVSVYTAGNSSEAGRVAHSEAWVIWGDSNVLLAAYQPWNWSCVLRITLKKSCSPHLTANASFALWSWCCWFAAGRATIDVSPETASEAHWLSWLLFCLCDLLPTGEQASLPSPLTGLYAPRRLLELKSFSKNNLR